LRVEGARSPSPTGFLHSNLESPPIATAEESAMDYVNLGSTGLKVSRICLGCMSYGAKARGTHAWVLEEEASRPFFRQALDAGINFFDTANVYSLGASEGSPGER
jgi:diketogulonate reductase-like aldo/keto reductase